MNAQSRYIAVPQENSGKQIRNLKKLKSKVTFFLGNKKIEVNPEVLAMFYLYDGKELSKKELNDILAFNESLSLWNYALSLRKKNIYTEWKMREKLYLKTDNKSFVDMIIKRMKANDLINDQMFALDFQEYYNEQLFGKNKIIAKLKEKGVFEKELRSLKFPVSKENNKANAYLKKIENKYNKFNNESKKEHLYRALITNGFEHDIVMSVLEKITYANDKEELAKLKKDFDKVLIKHQRKYIGKELKEKVVTSLRGKGYKIKDILCMWEKNYYEID